MSGEPVVRARRPSFAQLLWLIVVVAALIRVVYALGVVADRPLEGDAFFYHHSAELVADGEGLVFPYELFEFGIRQEAADHPPLFVLYLALWSLVGLGSVSSHLVAGALLGTAGVALGGLLGRRLGGPAVGLVAGGLMAVYPNLVGWDSVLLSEPAAEVTALLVAHAALTHLARRTVTSAVVLGAAAALATLARPELALLVPFVVVPAIVAARSARSHRAHSLGTDSLRTPSRRATPRDRLGHLVAAGLATLVVLAPWVGYNLARFDEPVLLSTNLGVTLSYTNCDSVYSGSQIGYWDFRCGSEVVQSFAGQDLDQSVQSARLQDAATDYIRANLDQVPVVVAARVGRVTGLYAPRNQIDLEVFIEKRDRSLAIAGLAMYYPLAILAIAGFVVLGRRRTIRYPVVAPIAIVIIASAATYGTTRFRASAEPMLCVLAAVAIVEGVSRFRSAQLRSGHTAEFEP